MRMRGMRTGSIAAATLAVALLLSGCVFSVTGTPDLVADASVRLTGVVHNSRAESATVWFEYGPTTAYGSTAPLALTFLQSGSTPVSAWADGLVAGTTYHYRLCSDSADALPASCGADRTVTTTVGHDSVHGAGTYVYAQPPFSTYYDTVSVDAVGDPVAGTVDGAVGLNGLSPGTPMSGPIGYNGTGAVRCLRVSGNIAVVGYAYVLDSDVGQFSGEQGIAMEDNGVSGDRYVGVAWSSGNPCPTPSASLFASGTPHDGSFVVHDG